MTILSLIAFLILVCVVVYVVRLLVTDASTQRILIALVALAAVLLLLEGFGVLGSLNHPLRFPESGRAR